MILKLTVSAMHNLYWRVLKAPTTLPQVHRALGADTIRVVLQHLDTSDFKKLDALLVEVHNAALMRDLTTYRASLPKHLTQTRQLTLCQSSNEKGALTPTSEQRLDPTNL